MKMVYIKYIFILTIILSLDGHVHIKFQNNPMFTERLIVFLRLKTKKTLKVNDVYIYAAIRNYDANAGEKFILYVANTIFALLKI